MKLTPNFKRNLLVIGASIAAIGYIFSIATTSIGIILFLFTWLLNYKELNLTCFYKINRLHYMILFYLILVLGAFYTLDISQAYKEISKLVSFILLPLVFLTVKPFKEKERFLIKKVFSHSLTIFFLICLLYAIYRQVSFYERGGIFNWYFFYRHDFLEVFNQHPTYASMYTSMSIGILLHKGQQIFNKKWFFFITILIQTLAIILYGSRIGYILLFLIILLFMFKWLRLKRGKDKKVAFFSYVTVLVLITIVFCSIPIVKERVLFTIGYQQNYKYNDKETIKEGSPVENGRLLLWKDAIDLIKQKPFFGYGTGSNMTVLLKKYELEGRTLFINERYNTHNTYLELLISGGIPLLLSYLLILVILVRSGLKTNKFLLIIFFLIVAMTSLTETIFKSQGVAFLAFFYCFLLSKSDKKKKGMLLIGPYPPPVGGISLFIKKLDHFINSTINTEVNIINEFGSNNDNNSVYNLSSNSKLLYFFRLLYYLCFLNTNQYVYYHGVHGITRFTLVLLRKILNYEVIFHFHGKSVVQFHEKSWLTKRISFFSLTKAKKLIAVNNDIVNELKGFIPFLEISNIPAHLPDYKVIKNYDTEFFFNKLAVEKKYYLSYATLDKAKNGKYNYGITDLIDFFNKKRIREKGYCLILVIILYKKEHFEEYEENLSSLLNQENTNVEVFINDGNTPLIPFFKYVEGYIRWTYEDGLGVSLIEALDYGISAFATNVCKRPIGVGLFDIHNPMDLEKYILVPSKGKTLHKSIDYEKEYIKLFMSLNFNLKS